jgi:hypothetical protein
MARCLLACVVNCNCNCNCSGRVPCSSWEAMDDMFELAVDRFTGDKIDRFVDDTFGTKGAFSVNNMIDETGLEDRFPCQGSADEQSAWLFKHCSEDRRTNFVFRVQSGRWHRTNGFRSVGSNLQA